MSRLFRLVKPGYNAVKQMLLNYPRLYRLASRLRSHITIIYPESKLAHNYLDGLHGIEIGASGFNPFGLETLNINYTTDQTAFRRAEAALNTHAARVDVVANGDLLPFDDGSLDFVLTSHVIEHFGDPITALQEWWRVIRPGGYLFTIVPHRNRTFDRNRSRTTLAELLERHRQKIQNLPSLTHHNVWVTEDFTALCEQLHFPIVAVQDVDDKVGNGFTVVARKPTVAA